MDSLLSNSGISAGLPGGLYTSPPNSCSNCFLPRSELMAVMPSSFFSYGSKPASVTVAATAAFTITSAFY